MFMFDKIRSKVGKKAHDAKILIKIKSKGFAMSRKITYFAPLPRNRCQEELLGMLRWVRSNNLISKKKLQKKHLLLANSILHSKQVIRLQ